MARRTVVGLLVFMLLLLLRSTASGQLLGSRWDWAMARIRPRSLVRSFLLLLLRMPLLLQMLLLLFLLLLLLLLRMPLLLLLFLLLLLLRMLLLILLLLQSLNLVLLLLLLLLLLLALRRRVGAYSTPRASGDWYSPRTQTTNAPPRGRPCFEDDADDAEAIRRELEPFDIFRVDK